MEHVSCTRWCPVGNQGGANIGTGQGACSAQIHVLGIGPVQQPFVKHEGGCFGLVQAPFQRFPSTNTSLA